MQQVSGLELRVAEPADALCVGVLAIQVFLDTYATAGIRGDLAREALATYSPAVFEAQIRDSANHFVLAERAGHLLAFSECSRSSPPPTESLSGGIELVRLYVQRQSQGQGVGAALLAGAESYARHCGAPLLWLTAWVGNANARAFYAAQGYTDVGVTHHVFEGQAYENRIYSKVFQNAP
jgi:GNAT superfamily N-acetyltransferase